MPSSEQNGVEIQLRLNETETPITAEELEEIKQRAKRVRDRVSLNNAVRPDEYEAEHASSAQELSESV